MGYTVEFTRINVPNDYGFLQEPINNWCNHRGLLLLGILLTKGLIIEFGSGEGSTPYLRNYCKAHDRPFETWESNEEWAKKTGSNYTSSWDLPSVYRECGLFFCDHSPGEHRKVAVERMKDKAQIIVIHDTELGGAGDYQLEPVLSTFRYRLNYNMSGGGAGATMVSNTIDVNRFRGLSLGTYKFDDD